MRFQPLCRPEKCRIRCIDEIKYKVYEKRCIVIVKECPRCGCECDHMVHECPSCGYRNFRVHGRVDGIMQMGHMGHMGHMGQMGHMGHMDFDDDDDD